MKLEGFATETVGMYTLGDIREELRKPGRDPREKFVAPQWREDVREIADLKPGMTLEGVVTNVTRFGAFVDIGVHQDGLVHVSQLSHRFVKEASEVVKAGQIVKVQVMNADPKAEAHRAFHEGAGSRARRAEAEAGAQAVESRIRCPRSIRSSGCGSRVRGQASAGLGCKWKSGLKPAAG